MSALLGSQKIETHFVEECALIEFEGVGASMARAEARHGLCTPARVFVSAKEHGTVKAEDPARPIVNADQNVCPSHQSDFLGRLQYYTYCTVH
jgi:hypothetical protein